jgi:alpha-L-arabinofuranosidase
LPQEAEFDLAGRSIARAASSVLSDEDLAVHNTFEEPNRVKPAEEAMQIDGHEIRHIFPAASVTRLQFELG